MPENDESPVTRRRAQLLQPCASDAQLLAWIECFTGLHMPTRAVCPHHNAPFDYIRHAYFEPTKDSIVWAPRGGGKTRLAAVATFLDLLHKPPIVVRILGGSLEQSMRMWEHLLPDLEREAKTLFVKRAGSAKRIELTKGASVAVLTQSQRAVRGLRVQKLRCDEVEMFDDDIWEAAQLVTRSRDKVRGAIDALSTAHKPGGLMSRIIESAAERNTRVFRWCILDVLERCEPSRDCASCPLFEECQGIAKTKCDGFVKIDDAIAMKRRVSLETWQTEMLCKRPTRHGCVFPTFDLETHVKELPLTGGDRTLAIDFGFAAPFVCLWIESRPDGSTYVFDEYLQPQQTIDVHLEQIDARPWGRIRRVHCDPAGSSRNDQTGASNIQVMRAQGFVVKTKHAHIAPSLELVRVALRPASGSPRLFIHPRCKKLILAMRSYRYDSSSSELPNKDGEHDHPIDALRYHFVNAVKDDRAGLRAY